MKIPTRAGANSLLLALFLGCGSMAAPAAPAAPPTNAPPATAATSPRARVKFRPPVSGGLPVRVTGGSRGAGETSVQLDVLAPDEVGLTTREQPSVFWYQSKPANARFELTVLQENKVKPLLHMAMDHASKAGIQRLNLSDYGVKLAPGIEYQWVVALVTDPDNRSGDLVASGFIKLTRPNAELTQKIGKATPASRAEVYAEEGIWYDALAALSDQIEANPANKALHEARADLLRQVGLTAAAGAEESPAGK